MVDEKMVSVLEAMDEADLVHMVEETNIKKLRQWLKAQGEEAFALALNLRAIHEAARGALERKRRGPTEPPVEEE